MCKHILFLLIAGLMLSGCASWNKPSTPQTPQYPPLDSRLALPCPPLSMPDRGDYDYWQDVMIAWAFQYAQCAIDKAAIVKAWPRSPQK